MDDLLTQLQDLSHADQTAALAALNAPAPTQAGRIIVTQQSQFTRKLRLFSGRTVRWNLKLGGCRLGN